MKIGEISRRSNLSIATIRYYINTGLIVPVKKNTKYVFNQHDLQTVNFITQLKDMGFSIADIHRILSLKRVSNWVEPEDLIDYTNLLHQQKALLEREMQGVQEKLDSIEREFQALETRRLYSSKASGVPTRALELLVCPYCKVPLRLENAQMNYQYIQSCTLHCGCSYTADIRDGIIYTKGGEISRYDKPDTNRTIYKEMPSELVTYFQMSYNWIFPRLNREPDRPKTILETHLNSFFFLYKHLDKLSHGNLYIICDKFAEIVEMYKANLERLGLDLDIVYIVNNDNALPIQDGVVDVLVDYCSTNEHEIFFPSFLLEDFYPLLREGGEVLSAYFSFDADSRSLKQLQGSYPENTPENYQLWHFEEGIKPLYQVRERERIGVARQSGEGIAFIFHHDGENLYIDCFRLVK